MRYTLKTAKYRNNDRLCLQVNDDEGPYAVLSVNVSDVPLLPDEFVLNHDLNHQMFDKFRQDMLKLFCEDTGKTCDYGYIKNQPIWRLK